MWSVLAWCQILAELEAIATPSARHQHYTDRCAPAEVASMQRRMRKQYLKMYSQYKKRVGL